MTHGDTQYLEPGAKPRATNGFHAIQFSLTTLFGITTGTALILGMFFSVGRLIGMSTLDVVTHGLGRFLYTLPALLVWIVGFILAMRRRKQYRLPATLTLIALGALVLTTVVVQLVQMGLIHSISSNRISQPVFSWSLAITGILHVILNTGCWILILMAIFAQRRPDLSETKRSDLSGEL